MNELEIILSDINPQEFFGNQNSNLELLKSYYPKLKIIARGNKIKAFGDEEVLEEFDKRINQDLDDDGDLYLDVDEIACESDPLDAASLPLTNKIYSKGGKVIKAKTLRNSKSDAFINNDMVFAIGPAGTGKTYTGVADSC